MRSSNNENCRLAKEIMELTMINKSKKVKLRCELKNVFLL